MVLDSLVYIGYLVITIGRYTYKLFKKYSNIHIRQTFSANESLTRGVILSSDIVSFTDISAFNGVSNALILVCFRLLSVNFSAF